MLKVFVTGAQQDEVAARPGVHDVSRYQAFTVVEADDAVAADLNGQFLVEDITDQYAIPLGGRLGTTIDTSAPRITAAGRTRSHPAYTGARRLAPGPHHYLVQFVGPVKQEWLDQVAAAGGELVDTRAAFTIVVRADESAITAIAGLECVRWTGHLPPAARVDLAADAAADEEAAPPRTRLLPHSIVVEFFTPREARSGRSALRALGAKVTADESASGIVVIEQPEGTAVQQRRFVEALSAVHGVRSVRRRTVNRISNDVATSIMRAVPSAGLAAPGLDGSGEVVGICDTGLDVGTTSPAHPDFAGRVKAVLSYPISPDFTPYVKNPGADDGAADLDSGHGTHVAGSAVGDGTASAAIAGQVPIRGVGHKAKLVFQAVEQAIDWKDPADLQTYGRYLLAGIPADISTLFADAYARGVRVHSNSWGGGDAGAYDTQCRQLDAFVWSHPQLTVLVAAGNDGSDADGDGQINLGSVTSPGTAKNCITVGASENLRPDFDTERYGDWWPQDYPAPPYKGAPMADDPEQVVAFSSRGPTTDGRTKPDVVAPGTWILSTKSTMLSPTATAWSPFPPSKRYFYMGGTSMATPLTAGAVAGLRQHLRTALRVARPTGALLKATLVAGARRLPGIAPAGAVLDPHQGFGRVDLAAITNPPAGVRLVVNQTRSVQTGQSRTTTVTVASAAEPLRIVLAYSDFPGEQLVNNLNLIVTAPDGTRRVGNQSGSAAPSFDTVNNVEVVHVDAPATGTWTIEVVGSNVPQGPQTYALVVRGTV
ncbi:MAG: S8 family serine peptidase [Kineosporiaceae bacterium]|nr:S8 family serine peptidase [Kineosporiaceae bacterium]